MARLPNDDEGKHGKSRSQTLLASVLLSAPGPVVIGLGLLVGRSSTQMADFLRISDGKDPVWMISERKVRQIENILKLLNAHL